jgi:hypothetical protein
MDAQRYDRMLPKKPTGRNQSEEERMEARYPIDPQLKNTVIRSPKLILDGFGRALVWFIPGALSMERQVSRQYKITTKIKIHTFDLCSIIYGRLH